jgi:peptidyl-prolyl cis-trans isomerase D
MLDLMRRHARNWMMKVILGIIILVFIFYFGSMGGKQVAERIALLDGKPIVYADFQREYHNLTELYRQRFGQGLTEEMLKTLNLKQRAYDYLINQAVILKKAEDLHIHVTEEEVRAAILAYPGFQYNGAFDQRLYDRNLRTLKMTAEEFEENQRKMIVTLKLDELIQDGIRVSDQEVYELFRMQSEKINIDFVEVAPKGFLGAVKTSPADLEGYLKAHEGQFRVPEQVQLKYLAFMGRDYAAGAKISDDDVADYYDRNKGQWTKDKKVQPLAEVREKIVAELAAIKGMYAASDEAKKAHDTIYQEENFDAYAAQKKLTVRTTGLFRLNQPPEEFRSMADFVKIVSSLQKNEISRVLQGEKGYYLLMVTDRKAPYVPAFKEIETEVARLYRDQEAKRLAQQEAEALLGRLKKGRPLGPWPARKVSRSRKQTLPSRQRRSQAWVLGGAAEALFLLSEKKALSGEGVLGRRKLCDRPLKERTKANDADSPPRSRPSPPICSDRSGTRCFGSGSRAARLPWSRRAVWNLQGISRIYDFIRYSPKGRPPRPTLFFVGASAILRPCVL